MSPTPPKLLSEKQLDEFDALADYFVMLWSEQERGGLSKHASHDQKTHGKWANGPGYSSTYNNRAELVAIRGYQERARTGEVSGWNPKAESVAERMAGVTAETLLSARKFLAEKWQAVFPEQVDPELKQQRQQLREEARLRRAYQRMNVEPMPPSVKGVFDRLKQSHDEIVGTFPYTTTNVFSDLMESYAEEIGMPVEVARKEFRNMRRVFDPLGLHYPELAPPPFDPYPQIRAASAAKRMRTASPKALQAVSLLETPGGTENKMLGNTAAARTWESYIRRRESQRKWTERKTAFRQALDGDGDGFIFDGTPLERRVGKHASHNQQSHGNWAKGRSVYARGDLAPVKDKLDVEGKYSAEANLLATQLRASQAVHDSAITRVMDAIAVENGGMLEGIEFRLKTTESLARKIDSTSIEDGISKQAAAQDMKDVLRYTFKFPERQYTQRVNAVYEAMQAQGFALVNSKNYWESGDAYDGVNANFRTPQGFLIEVQFHTPTSLRTKDPSHALYELYRGDQKALAKIGLDRATVTESQRKAWWDEMVGMWLEVNRPKGILEELPALTGVETFKPLAKAAFRYFAKMDSIGQPRAYYRLAKGKSRIVEERWDRMQGRWVDDKNKSVSWWMVSGEPMELEEIPNPGLGGVTKASGGLSRWFKEEWVDISRPKKGGGFEPCGRKDADEGKYPKCVPKSKAMKMSQAEIDSAVRRKRRAESTQEREGKKPINVSTSVKKSKNIPSNPKLYAKVKAEAKRKFDVYPSAYANGWLVQEYKRRGGTYKTVEKQQPTSSDVHVPSTDWKFKRKKKRKKIGLSGMLEKHAQHDQKSHGNWATGGGSPKVSGPTAKRDAHISQYGLMWTEGNDENPDVLAAKRIPDELWRKKPKEMFDPSELNPTEEWIGSRHVDKVVSGREPFREGYDPYVIRDRQGKLWIVDGHHRAAMYAGLGQKMPAHVWDWGMQPSEEISRWEETIKIARRRMNNLSADYPGNKQVQSSERKRMAESIASMEAKIKELEAERKRLGLSKHASHDQKTHGNWATGRGQSYQLDIFGGEEKYGVKLTPKELKRRGLPSSLGELLEVLHEDGDVELGLTVEQVLASYDLLDTDFTVGGMVVALSNAEAEEMAYLGEYGEYEDYLLIEEHKSGKSVEVTHKEDFWNLYDMGFDQLGEIEEQSVLDWRDGVAFSETLYHGTDLENLASIAKNGIEPMRVTRGSDNRQIGDAIFMSMDSYFSLAHYANNKDEGLIEIDFARLLEDGVLKIEDAFPEPPVVERLALEELAGVFGVDAYSGDYGTYPDTTVIYEGDFTIPPKYLSINGVPITEVEADDSVMVTPKLEKGQVSMQERLARIRTLYEHVPDRYKADPKEAKKKVKYD